MRRSFHIIKELVAILMEQKSYIQDLESMLEVEDETAYFNLKERLWKRQIQVGDIICRKK